MKNKNILIVVIVIIIACTGFGMYIVSTNKNDAMIGGHHAMSSVSSHQPTLSDGADNNSAEYKMYSNLKGEDYDKMFLANMIAHHQGAVEMATLARANAKHQEIKDMANAIISIQNKEIGDMQSWQSKWGYPKSSGEMMMDHSAMGMMSEMGSMTEGLKGLTGDAFDKAFLSSMIEHHLSAINMAVPGSINAEHQEIKEATKAMVATQTDEVQQMKQWQKEWGY